MKSLPFLRVLVEYDIMPRSTFMSNISVKGRKVECLGSVLPGESQDAKPTISVSSARREKRRTRGGGAGGEEKEERKLKL